MSPTKCAYEVSLDANSVLVLTLESRFTEIEDLE